MSIDEDTARKIYDVVIIGYGPVGRVLALRLGLRGHSVAVVERRTEQFALPRAAHFDDETARILQSVGASPADLPAAIEPYNDFYEWRAADWSTLLRLDWRGLGPSGWNVSNFFIQPDVERFLDDKVKQLDTVDVLLGRTVTGRVEAADSVTISATRADGEVEQITGRYVVGADGANSIVNEWIAGGHNDLGYFHDWLVVDLLMKDDSVQFDPGAWQLCDPARPTTLVPGGPGRRRFEFMRLPGESKEDLESEDFIWRVLEPWSVNPGNAEIVRKAVYTFQARWANVWRRERLMVVGDAAHLMPPFAGQGMCSGLRDAVNLEWKLDLVLRGRSGDAILDSYGPERTEHVRHFIAASMELGEVICITDPEHARARDQKLQADLAADAVQPARPLPRLGAGIHRADAAGGLLSVQGVVASGSARGLFDDVVGSGGALLLAEPSLLDHVDDATATALAADGIAVFAFGETPGPRTLVDVDGTYGVWLADLDAVAVLVRPDFYVYGAAESPEQIADLAASFTDSLSPVPA